MKKTMSAQSLSAEARLEVGSRTLRRAFLCQAAVVLAMCAAFVVLIGTTVRAGGDGTIGSLPSADGGDGSQSFYFTGDRSLVTQSIVDAYGTGYYVPINLPNGQIWLEFYGDVTLVFDGQVLHDNPALGMGLNAGFNGGGMTVLAQINGQVQRRPRWVGMGFSMSTNFHEVAELAQQEFALLTMQRQTMRRGRIDYDLTNDLFTVTQDIQDR
jgi:hypothetical protein